MAGLRSGVLFCLRRLASLTRDRGHGTRDSGFADTVGFAVFSVGRIRLGAASPSRLGRAFGVRRLFGAGVWATPCPLPRSWRSGGGGFFRSAEVRTPIWIGVLHMGLRDSARRSFALQAWVPSVFRRFFGAGVWPTPLSPSRGVGFCLVVGLCSREGVLFFLPSLRPAWPAFAQAFYFACGA